MKRLYFFEFALLSWLGSSLVHAQTPPATIGWSRLANTKIADVCAATHGFPQIWGVEGCPAILSWSGGAFDTKRNRMIVTGGGHNAYYGNELYSLDINSGAMTRLTDPGLPPADGTACSEAIANGTQPNSRHTYDGVEYMANVDRLFVFSGSLACGSGDFGQETWTYDFTGSRWERKSPTLGTQPRGDAGMMTAYDPNTGLIFINDRQHLFSYDFNTNTYKQLSTEYLVLGYHMVATIDPKRKKFIIAGYDSAAGGGRVYAYDIGPGSAYAIQTLATTGGDAIIGNDYPGLEYDSARDRIVAWNGGGTAYSLNLDTLVWTADAFSNGPGAPPISDGTMGRWRYSPAGNAFILVNAVDQDAYVLRFTAGGAAGTTAPAKPTGLALK